MDLVGIVVFFIVIFGDYVTVYVQFIPILIKITTRNRTVIDFSLSIWLTILSHTQYLLDKEWLLILIYDRLGPFAILTASIPSLHAEVD